MLERLDSDRLRLLVELSRSFAGHTDLQELISLVVTRTREIFDVEGGVAVLLLDRETGELYFPYAAASDPVYVERIKALRIPASAGIAGAVLRSGRPEVVADVQNDPRYLHGIDQALGFNTGSIAAVPLATQHGTMGLIYVAQKAGAPPFSRDDLAFLECIAGSVALAIDNAQMYGRLKASEEELRLEIGALRRDLERRDRFTEIIGTSAATRELVRLMESAAATPIPVLIEGETGTGKELVARGIHRASPRGAGPFLAVPCGALSEALLESELFGHERGAFTGADTARRGVFESTSGGTILLDGVEDMPFAMQVKLLRVLQEGEVIPVGSTTGRPVDVRVISAARTPLREHVEAGSFRADLYYRLAGFPIRVPPLRERREDIPALVDHLLQAAAERHGKRIGGITPEAREVLAAYPWPGNIRQLKNELERAVALAQDGEMIRVDNLSEALFPAHARKEPGVADGAVAPAAGGGAGAPALGLTLREARVGFEARYIAEVLEREGGNVSRAAEVLGISRVMLHRKLKSLRIR